MTPANAVRRWLCCLSAAFAICVTPLALHAKGAPLTNKSKKVFLALIVQGERPEIALCMVAATDHARHDARFDAIRWANDVSDAAYMRESEGGIHMTRTVRFKAELRERSQATFFATWRPAEIVCEQRDEEMPEVRLVPATQ